MSIKVAARSRLRYTNLMLIDGVEFWDTFVPPDLPEQYDDIQYQILGSDRIDMLAAAFYGDPTLWWVIAVANDMELIPIDFKRYEIIRIPSPRFVLQELPLRVTRQGARRR